MAYNVGAVVGYVGFGFLADMLGRKPTRSLSSSMTLLLGPMVFLWTHDLGAAAVRGGARLLRLGQYTWMSAWLPELYPTRMRATGAGSSSTRRGSSPGSGRWWPAG